MSDMVIDILRRSISAETAHGYMHLVQQINNHDKRAIMAERMTDRRLHGSGGKRLGNPHDDPLYRLLVKEAQDKLSEEQKEYKERLRMLKSLRRRVEQFMALLQTNEELQQRIEAARNKFKVQSDVLTQLRAHIERVQGKRVLVGEKLKQLQDQQERSLDDLKKQRAEVVQLMKELAALQTSVNALTAEEELLRKQLATLARQQEEEQKAQEQAEGVDKEKSEELARLATLIPKTKKAVEDLLRAIAQKTAQRAVLQAQIAAATAANQAVRDNAAKARGSAQTNEEELKKQLEEKALNEGKEKDLQSFLERMGAAVDKANGELEALKAENARLQAQLEADEKEFATKARQITDASGQNAKLLEQIAAKEAEREKLRKQEEALAGELQQLKDSIEARKTEIQSMQEKMKKAQSDNQSLESSEKGARERESETQTAIDKFNAEIAKLEKELAGNKDIEQLLKDGQTADQETLAKLLKEVSDRKQRVSELDIGLVKLQAELENAKKKSQELQLLSDISKAAKERGEIKQREDQLQMDIDKAVKEIQALGLNPEQVALASEDPARLKAQLDQEQKDLAEARERVQELQRKRDALQSESARKLMEARGELQALLQQEKDQALSEEEQARVKELQDIIGAPPTDDLLGKKLEDLRKQIGQLQGKTSEYQRLRSLLLKLQELKDQKNLLGQGEHGAQEARDKLINELGVDPALLTDARLAQTLADADAELRKIQSDIEDLGRQRDLADAQLPQLAKLSKDLTELKEAEKEKDKVKGDLDGLLKRLSDGLAKYDLGGLPDPKDLQAVAKYIKRLLDLQELARLLELQRLVDLLEMAVADLDLLKRQNPGIVKTAMDQILNGTAPSARDLLKDLKNTLSRHGLSTKGDPMEIAEALKKVQDEQREVAQKLKDATDQILEAAEKDRDRLQKILAVLTPYANKLVTMADAVKNARMQVVPAVALALKLTQETIQAVQPLSDPKDKTVSFLQEVEQKLKAIDALKPLAEVIGQIGAAVDQVIDVAKQVQEQNKLIDELTDLMAKNGGNQQSTARALAQLHEQVRRMKSTAIGENSQLVQLAGKISDALKNMVNSEAQSNRLGIRMSTISFSFHKDARGDRIQLPYKNPKDYTPDHQAMARVVSAIKNQIDAITRPGVSARLIQDLSSSNPSAQTIADVDDLVLAVWVYDLLFEFRHAYARNMDKVQDIMNELQVDVNRLVDQSRDRNSQQLQTQLQDIKKSIDQALVAYQTDIGSITKLFFINMQLPSKRLKYGESKFDTSIEEVDKMLKPFYQDYDGLDTLLPDGLIDAGQASSNDLSLLINNMQDVYSQVAILSSKNPAASSDAFTRFMKEFQGILGTKSAPLIALYNTPNLRQAQSLDQFVREILANTIKPSKTLLTRLRAIRDGIITQRNPLQQMNVQRAGIESRNAAMGPLQRSQMAPSGALAFGDKKPTRSFKSISGHLDTLLFRCTL